MEKLFKPSSLLPAKFSTMNGNSSGGGGGGGSMNKSKYLDKLVNQTPIGVFKKSQLGEAMRLYYYLSPLDLIKHHQSDKLKAEAVAAPNKVRSDGFDVTYKILSSLTAEQLVQYEIGSYVTISLVTATDESGYKLPDCSLLTVNENYDERVWNDAFSPYFNNNFYFEK